MVTNSEESTPAQQNEQDVRGYFENRGWSVTKLDLGKERAADFRICDSNGCFLCEIKTIESVRANFPSKPYDSYSEERKRRQDEIKKWAEENPGKRLILSPEDRDFVYEDEDEFTKRYRNRRRNTEKRFREFVQTMEGYFASSSIRDLPYNLRIDSNDLYVPTRDEQERFFEWLEGEIKAIDKGNTSRHWQVTKLQDGRVAWYSAFYKIHKREHENDIEAEYQLTIGGPRGYGSLGVNAYSYGGLNLDSITRNVEKGINQLKSSVSRENNNRIPRIIILAFQSGIGFEWQQLSSHIAYLLRNHPDLSAIALLDRTPDDTPPLQEEGFLAWIKFHAKSAIVPAFYVYHNSWLQNVKPLPVHVFSDEWSRQLCSIR